MKKFLQYLIEGLDYTGNLELPDQLCADAYYKSLYRDTNLRCWSGVI